MTKEILRRCKQCGKVKPIEEFHIAKVQKGKIVRPRLCAVCKTKKDAKRLRDERKQKPVLIRERDKVYRQKSTYKRNQSSKLRDAVRQDIIKRPIKCSICNRKVPIDGHHDDYSKPLKVRWLCKRCHKKIHKLIATCKGIYKIK